MKDSKGMVQITGSTPAYWIYSTGNAEMEGKNMLVQGFQESIYRPASLDFTAVNTYQFPAADIVAGTVTTWSDQWAHDGVSPDGIWRLNDTYVYNGKLPFVDFPAASYRYTSDSYPTVSASFPWQMSSNITTYDRYSKPVQDSRIDGNYISSLYSYGDVLPVAVASNARVGEIGYTGLENGWESWETGGSSISTAQNHAGTSSAYGKTTNVTTNNVYGPTKNFYCANGIDKNKTYILEGWAKLVNGTGKIAIEIRNNSGGVLGVVSQQFTSTNWQYVSVKITPQQMSSLPSDGYLRAWCGFPDAVGNEGYVDEIRFRPVDASIATYTYDPLTWKLTSSTDENSMTTYYEYDAGGRLALVRDQNRNILKRYAISYGRSLN